MNTPTILIINLVILLVLGLIARTVKSDPIARGGINFSYSASDLIIMAVLGVLSSVINTYLRNIWYAANMANPIYGAMFQGTFMWAYILAYLLIRKSGVMFIVALLDAALEALFGNVAGFGTFGWGLTQGLAAEIVMWFCSYGQSGWFVICLAAAAASQFGTFWSFILFKESAGWSSLKDYLFVTPISLISGFIVSGLVGLGLAKMIENTGLLPRTRRGTQ
jgi:ABC-type thiamin/hydroxymethylpyrimidine transport system permease subunit